MRVELGRLGFRIVLLADDKCKATLDVELRAELTVAQFVMFSLRSR